VEQLSYGENTSLSLPPRVNLMLNARTVVQAKLFRVSRNYDKSRSGNTVARFLDTKTGKYFEITTDRTVVTTGIGKDKLGLLNSEDEQSRRIIEEETKVFEDGGDAKVMLFSQMAQRLGDPENEFPLRGIKQLILSGNGNGGDVIAEALTGHGPKLGKSVVQLDWPEKIYWIGQKFATKEEFIECARARYHALGLEFPRKAIADYYYRIQPIPGGKLARVVRDGDRVGAVVHYFNEDGSEVRNDDGSRIETTFFADHIAISNGFEDDTKEIFSELYSYVYEDKDVIKQEAETILNTAGTVIYFANNNGTESRVKLLGVEQRGKQRVLRYQLATTESELAPNEIVLTPGTRAQFIKTYLTSDKVLRVQVQDKVPELEEVYDPEYSRTVPIASKLPDYNGETVNAYFGGVAAKLKPKPEEIAAAPAVQSIPENTASIFLSAAKVEALAKYLSRKDLEEQNEPGGIASEPRRLIPVELSAEGQEFDRGFVMRVPENIAEKGLPYDVDGKTFKLVVGAKLYNFQFPKEIPFIENIAETSGSEPELQPGEIIRKGKRRRNGKIKDNIDPTYTISRVAPKIPERRTIPLNVLELEVVRSEDFSGGGTIIYAVRLTPPLPDSMTTMLESLINDSVVQKFIAKLTKNANGHKSVGWQK
jgi:hypothetical protein